MLRFAFDRSSVLMDTNTQRIARRVLGDGPKQPNWRLRLSLSELAGPKGANVQWNQALLDLGALICTARAPKVRGLPSSLQLRHRKWKIGRQFCYEVVPPAGWEQRQDRLAPGRFSPMGG